MAEADEPTVTRDTLFGGRLVLDQPARGHRVGTDAVLLAAAAPPSVLGRVIDAGAGVGAVGLRVAQIAPLAEVTLIENDPTCLTLAARNIVANDLGGRVNIAACDLLSPTARRPLAGAASLVLTNPPFYRADRVRASPDPGRRAAHVISDGGLAAWLDACLALLAPNGTLIAIHKTMALPDILASLAPRLGDITLLAIHSRLGEPAKRVLVRGKKGSRAPFRIAAPLGLHDTPGFSAEAAALHQGIRTLTW